MHSSAVLALGDAHDYLVVNGFARHTGWLHAPMVDYTSYGVVLFGALLVTGWWLARRSGLSAVSRSLLAGAGVLLAVAVNQPVAHAVNEQRPYRQLQHVLLLVPPSVDSSFPSDHAVMAGATAVGLLFVSRRLGALGVLAALLMAFSRVYVGAHFPADVLAGLALGAAVAALVQVAAPAVVPAVRALTRTPLRPLLLA